MSLDKKEVDRVASLSRIELDDAMRERMRTDLSSILDYIEVLSSVPTGDVEPLYQVTGLSNRTREDAHRGDFSMDARLRELLIDEAPTSKNGFVKVRGILKK